jgi:hypothetical protein
LHKCNRALRRTNRRVANGCCCCTVLLLQSAVRRDGRIGSIEGPPMN